MKTTIKILFALVLSALLFSCTDPARKPEFSSYTFVTFVGSSYTVNEDTVQFAVPVQVYPAPNGDITVTVAVVDNPDAKAKVGTDFSLVNEVLSFTAADSTNTQNLLVNIVNHDGVFTSNMDFALEITEVVGDNVVLGHNSEVSVIIKDLDHPLSAILGAYEITGKAFYYTGNIYALSAFGFTETTLEPYEGDVTKVWAVLSPVNAPSWGIVSEDMKKITFPFAQKDSCLYKGEWEYYKLYETIPVLGDSGLEGVDYVEPEEGAGLVFTLDETADGTVYATHTDYDLWYEDESGLDWQLPIFGSKWGSLIADDNAGVVLTKK